MRQTLRGIVARFDAPPSVRYVRRVSAWQAPRSAWFFIQVLRPVLRFTLDCLPCLDTLDYSTHSAVCQEEIFIAVFPIWKQVVIHLTLRIISYPAAFVKNKFGVQWFFPFPSVPVCPSRSGCAHSTTCFPICQQVFVIFSKFVWFVLYFNSFTVK